MSLRSCLRSPRSLIKIVDDVTCKLTVAPVYQLLILLVQTVNFPLGLAVAVSIDGLVVPSTFAIVHWTATAIVCIEILRRSLVAVFSPLPQLMNKTEVDFHIQNFVHFHIGALVSSLLAWLPLPDGWNLFFDRIMSSMVWRVIYVVCSFCCTWVGITQLRAGSWRQVDVTAFVPMMNPRGPCTGAIDERIKSLYVAASSVPGASDGLFAGDYFPCYGDVCDLNGRFLCLREARNHVQHSRIFEYAYWLRHAGKSGVITPLDLEFRHPDHDYLWGFMNEPPLLDMDCYPELKSELVQILGIDRHILLAHISKYLHAIHVYPNVIYNPSDDETSMYGHSFISTREIIPDEELFLAYGGIYMRSYTSSAVSWRLDLQLKARVLNMLEFNLQRRCS